MPQVFIIDSPNLPRYLHGDVFRFPPHINLLSAMLGVGAQVGRLAGVTVGPTSCLERDCAMPPLEDSTVNPPCGSD